MSARPCPSSLKEGVERSRNLFLTQEPGRFLAKVSFLRRKTNSTQAPGRTRHTVCDSRWAPHSGREDTTAEQEQRPREGVRVRCVVSWQGEGGAGVLPPKRRDCLARCGSVRTGRPLAGRGRRRGWGGARIAPGIRIHVGFARRKARRVWYGMGWDCAVRLRVGWGCAVRLRVG